MGQLYRAQRIEKTGGEHVAVAGTQSDKDAICATELGTMFHEGLHVLMLQWEMLREAGIDMQVGKTIPHDDGDDNKQPNNQGAGTEYDVFYFIQER